MKAAVIFERGEMPQYTDLPDPIAQENEVVIHVKAAAIKHFDKGTASGKHYSTANTQHTATVIGGDGVGLLANGTRVFAFGKGMIAEKAVADKNRMIVLPEGIDDATAAALPNAVAGSAMALLFRAGIQPGETVLINGATGFTGKIAVQLAKHYGAGKVIVTGRNEASLQSLRALGADELISLKQDDAQLLAQLRSLPVDIVLDYLWGHTAELLLAAFKGAGDFSHKVRFVTIGSMAGDKIELSAEILRSTDLLLAGSGLGSWTRPQVQEFFTSILPGMFRLAAAGKLVVDTETMPLTDIEKLWSMEVSGGKRLVVTI